MPLPPVALSVRQPWAWAIIHAGKDVENRTWQAADYLRFRGRVAIHASKGMTKDEYEAGVAFMAERGVTCPAAIDLARGGIVGSVEIVDIVSKFPSHWFTGPRGLLLRKPEACEFIPAQGALGFFEWQRGGMSIVPAPAKWMLPAEPEAAVRDPQSDLFEGAS